MRDLITAIPKVAYTWAWIIWIGWFFVWEFLALMDRDFGDTFTEHSRPIVQATSFGWFISAGALSWVLYHFLFEGR